MTRALSFLSITISLTFNLHHRHHQRSSAKVASVAQQLFTIAIFTPQHQLAAARRSENALIKKYSRAGIEWSLFGEVQAMAESAFHERGTPVCL